MSAASLTDFEKKKKFLLEHEDFFLDGISVWFDLTHRQLTKYRTILKWYSIVANRSIEWNLEIMHEFKELIFVSDDPFPEINVNQSLPWSIEFITPFEDLWSWELLSQNDALTDIPVVRRHFSNRLYPYLGEYEECGIEPYNAPAMTLTEELELELNSLNMYKEWQLQSAEEIDKTKNIDWIRLSQNQVLPWSANLIEKYKEKWDWWFLCTNASIPWSVQLIRQFEDYIDWTQDITDEDGITTMTMDSISANFSIEWDAELLSPFITKLNASDICFSQCAKWDIDLLMQFSSFWKYESLVVNKLMWDKVFSEFNNEEHLNTLLDAVLEKATLPNTN